MLMYIFLKNNLNNCYNSYFKINFRDTFFDYFDVFVSD